MTEPAGAELVPSLGELPFLRGFDAAFFEDIAPAARLRSFATGDFLIREGTQAREFFLIREGKVALEVALPDRPHRTIQTIGPGEVLGWSWLVPPHRWSLDGRALKPTRAVSLDAGRLRATLAARPADGYRFLLRLLPVIAQRLENTRIQLLDLHAL